MKTLLLITALLLATNVHAEQASSSFDVRVKVIASVVGTGIEISPSNSTCSPLDSASELCWISKVRNYHFACDSEDTLRMVRPIGSDIWQGSQFNAELCGSA